MLASLVQQIAENLSERTPEGAITRRSRILPLRGRLNRE